MNKADALKLLPELEKQLAEVKAALKQEADWPQWGDKYWYVDAEGEIDSNPWDGDSYDKSCLAMRNCFRTKEEAELHKLRLETLATHPELREYIDEYRRSHAS